MPHHEKSIVTLIYIFVLGELNMWASEPAQSVFVSLICCKLCVFILIITLLFKIVQVKGQLKMLFKISRIGFSGLW